MKIKEHKQDPILQITDSNDNDDSETGELALEKRKIVELEEETQQKQLQQAKTEKEQSLQVQITQLQEQINNLQIQGTTNLFSKKREKLETLIRQNRRNLGSEDKLLDKLLATQKALTRVLYLDFSASEAEKELARNNHKAIFEEITNSNLS